MAIDYDVTLGAELPVEQVLAWLLPDDAQEATVETYTGEPVASVALQDRYGFLVTARSSRQGYVQLEWPETPDGIPHRGAGTPAEWTPERYVHVGFRMDKDRLDTATPALLAAVARLLVATSADVALTLDGALLLARLDGEVHRLRAEWWARHDPDGRLDPG